MKNLEDIKQWAIEHGFEEKIKDLYPLIESFDERAELFNALNKEAVFVIDLLKQDRNNQHIRRIFIKTSFSVIEGYLNVLNQTVLDFCKHGYAQLTKQEVEQLAETLDASNWFLNTSTNLYKKVGEESSKQSLERILKARAKNDGR